MEDDASKAPVPAEAPAKPAENFAVVTVMVVLVVGVGLFYWLSRPVPPAPTAGPPQTKPVAASPAPVASAPGAPPSPVPGSPVAFVPPPSPQAGPGQSATNGTIDGSTLAYGVILLENTPHAIKPEQAEKMKAVFDSQNPAWRRGAYLKALTRKTLTEEQRNFLDAQEPQPVGRAQTAACVTTLSSLSGAAAAGNVQPPPGGDYVKEPHDYIEPMVGHLDEMQQNPRTRLTRQQAAALAPVISTYNTVPTTFSTFILSELTEEQKTAIDQELIKNQTTPDAGAVTEQLKQLLEKKAKTRR